MPLESRFLRLVVAKFLRRILYIGLSVRDPRRSADLEPLPQLQFITFQRQGPGRGSVRSQTGLGRDCLGSAPRRETSGCLDYECSGLPRLPM
jgi:hypothetical protein